MIDLITPNDIKLVETMHLEKSLAKFIKAAWNVLEPGVTYLHNWHIDAIAEHLEAVTKGEIRNLVINMPPRCAKSLIVSVFWPCWVWTTQPEKRWIFASYAQGLAIRDSVKCRRLIESKFYQERWGHKFKLTIDQNTKTRFENNKTGHRYATSVDSAATGEGGDFITCFPYDTEVLTEYGYEKIGTLVEQGLVIDVASFNIEDERVEYKPIVNWYRHPGKELIKIHFSDGAELICTPDHPIYTLDRGYVEAIELEFEDRLPLKNCHDLDNIIPIHVALDIGNLRVCRFPMSIVKFGAAEYVYCIEVKDNHNFYARNKAGDNLGVLVSNCDDPMSAKDAYSDAVTRSTLDWWDNVMSTRGNDPKTVGKVIVMQRLAEKDLSGHVLAQGGYEHLLLPMEYESDRKCITSIGWEDPRKEEGELLWEERFGVPELDEFKKRLGSYGYAGQMQQRPSPKGGGMFQSHWFDVVPAVPATAKRVRYWDRAATVQKNGNDPDYTVGLKLAKDKDGILYVEDIVRIRASSLEVQRAIVNTAKQDGVSCRVGLEQDPGQAGKSEVEYLIRQLQGFIVSSHKVSKDKITRAAPASAQAEAGNIKVVRATWNEAFFKELEGFPYAAHDDIVDSLSGSFDMQVTSGLDYSALTKM